MKILFIGDIVAKPGRETVAKVLPGVLEEHQPDFVIANAENICHGDGFKPKHLDAMQDLGVNFFTTGNHAFSEKEGVKVMDDENLPLVRPANFPEGVGVPGKGYKVVEVGGKKLLIMNLMGRVFMKHALDCPFKKADEILTEAGEVDFVFLDFHAEATSEKYALSFYLDGRIGAIVGTHTHVATADARILEGGTAAITDVGMVGPLDSVIGVTKESVIQGFLTQLSQKHHPETDGRMIFNAVMFELDDESGKALNVQHVQKILA